MAGFGAKQYILLFTRQSSARHRLLALGRQKTNPNLIPGQHLSCQSQYRRWKQNLDQEMDISMDISMDIPMDIAMDIAICLLYTSPSPRDQRGTRMPSSA